MEEAIETAGDIQIQQQSKDDTNAAQKSSASDSESDGENPQPDTSNLPRPNPILVVSDNINDYNKHTFKVIFKKLSVDKLQITKDRPFVVGQNLTSPKSIGTSDYLLDRDYQQGSNLQEIYGSQIPVYKKFDNSEVNQVEKKEYFAGFFFDWKQFSDDKTLQITRQHDLITTSLKNTKTLEAPSESSDLNYPINNKNKTKLTLQFDSHFESGNLFTAYQTARKEYDLILQNDTNSKGNTQWFYFSVSNTVKNQTIRFNIVNLLKTDSLFNHGMKPAVLSKKDRDSALKKGWSREGFDVSYKSNQIIKEGSENRSYYTLQFSYKFEHANDTVYFAHCFPYSYSDLKVFLNSVESSNHKQISSILSRNSLCHSLGNNPCEILTITSPKLQQKTDNPDPIRRNKKDAIVIMARQHPGETPGSWVMEGVIEFLCNVKNQEAAYLRDNCVFKVIPMVNIDGVILGNYRTDLKGVDLNRNWLRPSKESLPAVVALKHLIRSLSVDHNIRYIIDLHGHSKKMNAFFYGNPRENDLVGPRVFPLVCSEENPHFDFSSCTFRIHPSKSSTARIALLNSLTSQRTEILTLESSFFGYSNGPTMVHFTTSDYKAIGISVCKSLAQILRSDAENSNSNCDNNTYERLFRNFKCDVQNLIKSSVENDEILAKEESNDTRVGEEKCPSGGSDSEPEADELSSQEVKSLHLDFLKQRKVSQKKPRVPNEIPKPRPQRLSNRLKADDDKSPPPRKQCLKTIDRQIQTDTEMYCTCSLDGPKSAVSLEEINSSRSHISKVNTSRIRKVGIVQKGQNPLQQQSKSKPPKSLSLNGQLVPTGDASPADEPFSSTAEPGFIKLSKFLQVINYPIAQENQSEQTQGSSTDQGKWSNNLCDDTSNCVRNERRKSNSSSETQQCSSSQCTEVSLNRKSTSNEESDRQKIQSQFISSSTQTENSTTETEGFYCQDCKKHLNKYKVMQMLIGRSDEQLLSIQQDTISDTIKESQQMSTQDRAQARFYDEDQYSLVKVNQIIPKHRDRSKGELGTTAQTSQLVVISNRQKQLKRVRLQRPFLSMINGPSSGARKAGEEPRTLDLQPEYIALTKRQLLSCQEYAMNSSAISSIKAGGEGQLALDEAMQTINVSRAHSRSQNCSPNMLHQAKNEMVQQTFGWNSSRRGDATMMTTMTTALSTLPVVKMNNQNSSGVTNSSGMRSNKLSTIDKTRDASISARYAKQAHQLRDAFCAPKKSHSMHHSDELQSHNSPKIVMAEKEQHSILIQELASTLFLQKQLKKQTTQEKRSNSTAQYTQGYIKNQIKPKYSQQQYSLFQQSNSFNANEQQKQNYYPQFEGYSVKFTERQGIDFCDQKISQAKSLELDKHLLRRNYRITGEDMVVSYSARNSSISNTFDLARQTPRKPFTSPFNQRFLESFLD